MRVVRTLLLTVFFAAVVLPLLWVLIGAFKTNQEIFAAPWALPKTLALENLARGWNAIGGRSFLNSVIATLATLVFLMPIGAMAAYIFAKYPFRGSKTLFAGFLGGMMFPNFLVVVPLFLFLKQFELQDTMTGLVVVYVAYSLSFTIFVLTSFFQAIPNDLAEAATLDGCGHAAIFQKVMLPLAKPGLIVVGIFDAIGLWNEYPLAMVLMASPENRTLPLGIADLAMNQNYQADWSALFAGMVWVMLPVILVYWFFRERIQQAMLAGAVKG